MWKKLRKNIGRIYLRNQGKYILEDKSFDPERGFWLISRTIGRIFGYYLRKCLSNEQQNLRSKRKVYKLIRPRLLLKNRIS